MEAQASLNQRVFQHTAARRRLDQRRIILTFIGQCFNTQPPEGGWLSHENGQLEHELKFQHTAARRRLGCLLDTACNMRDCFNTQPPEGGWIVLPSSIVQGNWFQHTAARRRLAPPKS